MSLGAALFTAAVAAACAVRVARVWVLPAARRLRRDLQEVRMLRQAYTEPESRAVMQHVIDRLTVIDLDMDLDKRIGGTP